MASSLTADVDIQTPGHWNQDINSLLNVEGDLLQLEKQAGRTTTEDIEEALEEYKRLYKAGIASPAEILTLHRAYPDDVRYRAAASKIEDMPVVIGGPASVETVDKEGHLITTAALKAAFERYMGSFRTRNAMVLHSDVQIGWALPAYISKNGSVFKSGVDNKGLFFITEIRNDTKIAQKVLEKVNEGQLRSYSIAGSATKTKTMQKGLMPYMQVDEMELAEVTICERGVNQMAGFDLLKAETKPSGSCADGSCLLNSHDHVCDACAAKAKSNKAIRKEDEMQFIFKQDGTISLTKTLKAWISKESVNSTLWNYAGRLNEHRQLTREQGFPSPEISVEDSRYVPVAEKTTDDAGNIIHQYAPWVVNEAGQDLGDIHDEDKLTTTMPFPYDDLDKAGTTETPAPVMRKGHNHATHVVMAQKSIDKLRDFFGV